MRKLIPNDTILHYRILEELGQGGMGVVYKAEDTKLKRPVALKFLAPHILATADERSRFIHEAQAAAALHHPNICTIYEINEADDQTFISMAFLEGQTLNEKLAEEKMSSADAVKIALQIAKGLGAAHDQGIIHRDIKSSNIMIGKDNRVTIMDFGLAKSIHQTHVTQRGTKLGTIAYMSPEQARGDVVDHRTDIWALGVLVYEMLTGQRPFRGDYDEAIIYSILNEEPPPLTDKVADAPLDMVYVVQKAMAKQPDDRYRTAAAMAQDLEVLYDELRSGSSSGRVARANGVRAARGVVSSLFGRRSVLSLAIYVLAAYLVAKATGWVVDRYMLSPHLLSIVIVALLSLTPTVWILAARNGAATRTWSLLTRIGIPVNIVAMLGVLLVFFAGRDIGAATKTIAVRDETGRTIERVVPKNEFRKSLALYLPSNESGDSGYDWAETAIGALVEIDLSQDEFLYLRSGFDETAKHRLDRAGFSTWAEAPWNLKREIAEKANMDYLLTGSFTVSDSNERETAIDPGTLETGPDGGRGAATGGAATDDLVLVPDGTWWEVTFRIHDTRSGRLAGQHTHRGNDLLALVDEATVAIRRDLGLPGYHIDNSKDLPVGEMVTNSMPALALFSKGLDLAVFQQEWDSGLEALEGAVAYDSTFAYAHCLLFEVYAATNKPHKRELALKSTMRHMYKLPERVQYIVKAEHYAFAKEPDKMMGVLELWSEIYPEDVQARLLLATALQQRGERERAISQYEKAFEIDPSRTEFLKAIAGQCGELGDFDRAISYYEAYAAENPQDADAYHLIGAAYEIQGEYARARENYEKTRMLDPSNVTVLVDLGDIHGKLGEDDKAIETYQQALGMSKTPRERARVYGSLESFYANRGQMTKAIESLRLLWSEEGQFLTPVNRELTRLDEICLFARAGREEEAFKEMEAMSAELAPPYNGALALGYMCIYIELEEAEKAEEQMRSFEKFVDTYQVESERGWVYWGKAKVEELRGNYETAIEYYQKNLELNPNKVTMNRDIGRCYRKLGRNDEAVQSLEKVFRVYPGNPTAHYEAALAYHELGNVEKANECLDKSLKRWEKADPGYEPARRARETSLAWTRPDPQSPRP